MATTKKKKPAPRRPVKAAPPAAPALSPIEGPSRNGRILLVLLTVALLALLWRSQRHAEAPAAAPAAAPVATAVPTGRNVAPPAPQTAKAAPTRPAVRREAAGAEVGAPSLQFNRGSLQALQVRCWRPEGGQAQLDVFGPRNQRVRSLRSESGAAGWQTLAWDGKDEEGRPVPVGLYYLRPSSEGVQVVRDVWVRD